MEKTTSLWSFEEVERLYHTPLLRLLSEAHQVHTTFHPPDEIQVCTLISFKTGGCTEDCHYCAQAARYQTHVVPLPLLQQEEMVKRAREARQRGATRICIAAAWREVREGKAFETLLSTISILRSEGVEVCCTLGMLRPSQAKRLKEAGLYAYNHNLDTSRRYYSQIISTRTYDDRLATLQRAEEAGLTVCCGGIFGMGESAGDRIALLHTLATRASPPASVPINFLQPIPGTPLEKTPPFSLWEMLRVIATARIIMPRAMIRLTAGREKCTAAEQALCFLAGANSLFSGGHYLTTPATTFDEDDHLFELLGLQTRAPFKEERNPHPATSSGRD